MTRPTKPVRFWWMFTASIIAAVLISLVIGYSVGSSNVGIGQLNDTQNKFVSGVALGGGFENDYQTWKNLPENIKSIKDVRAFPETRCAAEYYPQNPVSMSGCLQGINPPTDGKYFIPVVSGG